MIGFLLLYSQSVISDGAGLQENPGVKIFPYKILKQKNNVKIERQNQTLFRNSGVALQIRETKDPKSHQSSQKLVKEENRPKIIRQPEVPPPTENPYITIAEIIVTTGTAIKTKVATLTQIDTTIETSTTIGVFTTTFKYTETFDTNKEIHTLTISNVSEVVPTFVTFDKGTETQISTKSYTVESYVSLTHTTIKSKTQYLTYTKSTSDTDIAVSIAGQVINSMPFTVNITTFDEETNTIVYTVIHKTYAWTKILDTVTYTITQPTTFTLTNVKPNIQVTVSPGTSQFITDSFHSYPTSVKYTYTLITSPFPDPTPIPKIESQSSEKEVVTFALTHIITSTETAMFNSTKCQTHGVVSVWTQSPMYTSTFVQDGDAFKLTLTKTSVLLKAVTEIGESDSCFSISLKSTNMVTDVLTATTILTRALTETITKTSSIYYEVSKGTTSFVWSSSYSEISYGDPYNTVSKTNTKTLISNSETQTFIDTYAETIISTDASEYTTVTAYTTSKKITYIYVPSPKDTEILTTTQVPIVLKEKDQVTRSSFCTNYLSNQKTSISNTIVYTYLEYVTLVSFTNRGNSTTTMSELGTSIKSNIISVNSLESTVSTEINTVSSSKGFTEVNPGASITNSLLRTSIYTATYIDGKTDFIPFEDHCSFKKFTFSDTYSVFPVITNSEYDIVTSTLVSNVDLIQISVPLTYFISTYGYTVLDSNPTYVLADFMHFTMTDTFISAGADPTTVLSTKHVNSQTATGSLTNSKTIVEFIPIRTPFPTFSEELINPYYTIAELTFTKANPIKTYLSTIYQRATNYTVSTLTNIMTSTTMLTETFISSGNSVTYGYSMIEALVPTQVDVKFGQETVFLTYHTISTIYNTVTHYKSETLTQALTFSYITFEKPQNVTISSYNLVETSFCYHSFKVTEPTSAYTYTLIYDTWIWTKLKDSVTYTISKLSDYTYTFVSPISGKELIAYFPSYSCIKETSYYTDTQSTTETTSYTTYTSKSIPAATTIPTVPTVVEEKIKTFVPMNTFSNNVETYLTTLSPIVCESDIFTATLINSLTFKKTFTLSDRSNVQIYTQASTIAYTLTYLKTNETKCNAYVISKTTTNTEVFTNIMVEVQGNNNFIHSVTAIKIPYKEAKTVMTSSTLTYTKITINLGSSSNVTTFLNTDVVTFVQVKEIVTFTETFTASPVTTELKGPTEANVLKETSVNTFATYSAVDSSTFSYSMVYTQKPPQDMEVPMVQNPCLVFGTTQVNTNLQTYMETFSKYDILVTYNNVNTNSTTISNVGIIAQTQFTMAAFFSTTTVVSTSTVVTLGKPVVVNPNSTITNFISNTFTLTQVYISGPTKFTAFSDICVIYGITMKNTKIKIPTLDLTEALTLCETTVKLETPSDVEYITLANELEYREGLTMYKKVPTRTFSLYNSYTYTSSFFVKDTNVYNLSYSLFSTVVEKSVETYTLVIGLPPPPDEVEKNNNLIYIIIGVVIGVVVIAAIIVAVVLLKKREYNVFTDIDQNDSEDIPDESIVNADLFNFECNGQEVDNLAQSENENLY